MDPLELALATPMVPAGPGSGMCAESGTRAGWIDPLVGEVLRAVAWGGDRRRGAARLELGGSRFDGTKLVLHAEGREVSLELEAPPHVDVASLGERLRERLEQRGLTVRAVTYR